LANEALFDPKRQIRWKFAVVKGTRESEARRLYLSEELGVTLGLVFHMEGKI
jgi:hypothetical protein